MQILRLPLVSLSALSVLSACGGAQNSAQDADLPAVCEQVLDVVDAPVFDTPRTLIVGGTVMTAAGDIFEPGFVLFEDGRIVEVGPGEPSDPGDAVVVNATGQFVTPGLIDTHSHLGVYPTPYVQAHSDGNEATSPMTPQVQAVHSVWPQDPGFERALAGGVTSLMILPGSANLIGGRGFTMKVRRGARIAQELRFPGAPETLKLACGENPKRVYGERGTMPSTRMGSVATVRQAWLDAVTYAESWTEYREGLSEWCEAGAPDDEEPDEPAISLANETLAGVLAGDILPQIHCYRADEMLTQIEIADEFGFSIRSFHHAVEAYKIRDTLAEYNISVSTWADWWGFKIEAFDAVLENAALVHEAGAPAIIHSDSAIGIQRLNQEAAKAYYAGREAGIALDDNDALRWITYNAAWALGIEEQTGTLESGKMADVVVWNAHPLSVYARPDRVWVDGRVEFDRSVLASPWSDFEIGLWPRRTATQPNGEPVTIEQASESSGAVPGDLCIVGAAVHRVSAPVAEANVCIQDGEIVYVGSGVAAGAAVVDGSGMALTPGLVELRTQIGLVEIGAVEATRAADAGGEDPVRAAFRAVDALNTDSSLIAVSRRGGVTSVGALPSGGLISGTGTWLNLVDGSADEMVVDSEILIMSLGSGAGEQVGASRGTAVLRYREMFEDVVFWTQNRGQYDSAQLRDLAISRLDLQALQPALSGELPVLVGANSRADIRAALSLSEEYGLRIAISGGHDAWGVASELAEAQVPVVLNPLINLPVNFDGLGAREDGAAILNDAGVPVIISTGSSHNARTLRQLAGNAVRAGLPWPRALESITLQPARLMGLDEQYGAIEVGMRANLVLWSGDPLEFSTAVEHMWIEGVEQSLRSRQTELFERYRTFEPHQNSLP
ncbi:MAG: imidazolonepropionase-like amidohydrolase [Bradymonadia bacterium]|jgi:imidazolonepropionase-like amidohydrolase